MDAEMPAQPIAGSARHQAERRAGADQPAGDFVHGAIAADRHDEIASFLQRARRQLRGMSCAFRDGDPGPVLSGEFPQRIEVARGAAGTGIDDETGFQRRKTLTTHYTGATDWKNKTCRRDHFSTS